MGIIRFTMFKLVVLSALFAAVVAEPSGVLYSGALAPITYAANIAAPATTNYVQHASTYYPSPALYSSLGYPHFIKKRSAPFFNNYVAPSTYIASAPLVAPYTSTYVASAPIAYSSVLPSYAAPAHFIKKRSPDFVATRTSYVASTPLTSTYVASAPLAAPLASTYSTAILPTASYYPSYYAGYTGALPLIKK